MDRALTTLSGGERRRAELAALLLQELDLLVLDEPTNHLDVEAVAWLAGHLNARRGLSVVVVTHDRWFLDAVCTGTWEVADEQVHLFEGGYAAWTLARAERARVAAAVEQVAGDPLHLLRRQRLGHFEEVEGVLRLLVPLRVAGRAASATRTVLTARAPAAGRRARTARRRRGRP